MTPPRSVEEWAQWVREQPTMAQAVEVLAKYAAEQVAAALEDHQFCKDGLWYCHNGEQMAMEHDAQIVALETQVRRAST